LDTRVNSLVTGVTAFSTLNVTNQIRMTGSNPNQGIAIGGSVIDGLGRGASAVASAPDAVALGNGANASQQNAMALGYQARATGIGAVALGANAFAATTGSVAIGYGAVALSSVGIGINAQATGLNTTAVGDNAIASGSKAVALGNEAQATHQNAVAVGNGSRTKADNTFAVGAVGNERRITDVADGIEATDAATVRQLRATEQKMQEQIFGVQKEARRGIAIAMAMSGATIAVAPGETGVTLGLGSYAGQGAFALGVVNASRNGKTIRNFGIGTTSGGGIGVRMGIGFKF
jgi:trimeric autotransporter adhesin